MWTAIDNGDEVALTRAVSRGVDFRLERTDGETVVHAAVRAGNEKVLHFLLAARARVVVNEKDAEGHTALHACLEGSTT